MPDERFENCRALIDELANVEAVEEISPSDESSETGISGTMPLLGGVLNQPPANELKKEPNHDEFSTDSGSANEEGAVDPLLSALETSLSRVAAQKAGDTVDVLSDRFDPTIFIGVGGTGARVLQKLRRRICDRVGNLEECPSLQMVLLDTDVKSLNSQMNDKGVWDDIQVILMPLRRLEDYRVRESGYTNWLSRRWLYNIPHGLSTDGFRPLGRLAYVDHADRVVHAIGAAVSRATDSNSTHQSSDATGLPFK